MNELLKKKATLGRVIQIVEHFEMDEEWAALLNEEYQRILGEEPPKNDEVFMFLEVDSVSSSADLFNSLKERELITRDEVMVIYQFLRRRSRDGKLMAS